MTKLVFELLKADSDVFSRVSSTHVVQMFMFPSGSTVITCPVAPSSGQHLQMFNTLVYDQIPAELMTFPSSSAGL